MGWTIAFLAAGFGDVWIADARGKIHAPIAVLLIAQGIAGAMLIALTNINSGLGIGMTALVAVGIFYKLGI